MSEPARIFTIRRYVAAVSGLGIDRVIPGGDLYAKDSDGDTLDYGTGRAPADTHAAVHLIADEDASVPSVRYRENPDNAEQFQEQSSVLTRTRFQVDFVGKGAVGFADAFVRRYPLSEGQEFEQSESDVESRPDDGIAENTVPFSTQRVSRMNEPDLEGEGWREGAKLEIEVLWREESAWEDIDTFDEVDVRLGLGDADEEERVYPLEVE